jgi:pimeloyl-ACP methyl ester carboxylesterase
VSPAVVCIHSSASSGAQWRALTEQLAERYRVFTPDLYGCGKTPFDAAGERFHLVGHSSEWHAAANEPCPGCGASTP